MLPFKPVTVTSSLIKKVIIERIIDETSEAKTIVIRPLEGTIDYQPGQFLTFAFQLNERVERRSYSISSSPDWNEPLAVTVKRIPNGAFSRPLFEWAEPGDQLTLAGGATGFFTLPSDLNSFDQVIFLAAGSGIAPVFSMMKSLVKRKPHVSILLVYSNASPENTIFRQALIDFQKANPTQLNIEWLFSNNQDLWKARLNKIVLARLLKAHRTAVAAHALVYLCGPFDYMRMASIVLQSDGIPMENIRREVFTPGIPVSIERPPDTLPHRVSIIYNGMVNEMRVQYPDSILEVAKMSGLELPYSCEAGRCGSCVATCIQGSVWMKFNEVLTDREVTAGRVLICNGFPVGGDVLIRFD